MVKRQLTRFAVVGIASNATLYALFVLLTFLGLDPKVAMTLLFILGVLANFVANRIWTFGHRGRPAGALARYAVLYLGGYLTNLAGLAWFVDVEGKDPRLVQAVLIVFIAGATFLVQKYWVFRADPGATAAEKPRPDSVPAAVHEQRT